MTRAAARRRVRVEGTVQGVGFRPFVYRLADGARARRAACCNDERGVRARGRGRRRTRSTRFLGAAARRGAAAGARSSAVAPSSAAPPTGERGFAILDERARRRAARAGLARRRDLRRLPAPSCFDPPTAATATRSSTAPTAGRASRSSAASPTTGRSRRWPASRCARAAGPSTRTRATAASTPQPNACPACGPRARLLGDGRPATDGDARRPRALLRDGAIVAVKGLGGYHLACRADDEAAVARAARAQAPRGQAVRADGARPRRRRARWSSSTARRGAAADRPRAADRDRAAARRAPRSPRRSRRAARELGVMLPYSPLHHLLLADAGRAAGDDQRQRLRRADRLPRRRRARAPRRDRRRVPRPRPPDPDPHRRLGRARRAPAGGR